MKKVYKINDVYFKIDEIKTIEEPVEEEDNAHALLLSVKYINDTKPKDCKRTKIVINDKPYSCKNYVFTDNNPMKHHFCWSFEESMEWFEQERLHPSTIEITNESTENYEKQRQEYFDLVKAFKEL